MDERLGMEKKTKQSFPTNPLVRSRRHEVEIPDEDFVEHHEEEAVQWVANTNPLARGTGETFGRACDPDGRFMHL